MPHKFIHVIHPGHPFDRSLLAPSQLAQLSNISPAMLGARPRGLLLFSGSDAKGKLLAAKVLAAGLGRDIYRIDLSQVVSKYIGETEQNVSKIFREAEHACAILLFDEADALFGKRSAVNDSHDRYANLEISFLLEKMETYNGLAILATNLRDPIDSAFTRRLKLIMAFPVPSANDRHRTWQGAFPEQAPEDNTLQKPEFLYPGVYVEEVRSTNKAITGVETCTGARMGGAEHFRMYLEQSIMQGIQWAAFEPNAEPLWMNVKRSIEDFLRQCWISGALLGSTEQEAFFVKCDRTTMTADDIASGRLVCLVGVAVVKPAEFVIFRIQQKTGHQ